MIRIKSYVNSLYDYVSYHGIEKNLIPSLEKEYVIVLNRYLFMIFLIFLIQGLSTGIIIGFTVHVIILWVSSCLTLIVGFFLKKILMNKMVVVLAFIYLIFIVTYYSSLTAIESGCYLYYFSILMAVPIFFSLKRDTFYVLTIVFVLLVSLYVSAFKDFQLWGIEAHAEHAGFRKHFLILNITCQLMLIVVNYFFLEEKRNDHFDTLQRNKKKKKIIKTLNLENSQLKELIDKKELSEESLKDLLNTISLSDILFLEKFQLAFPSFRQRLYNHTIVNLTTSELTLCGMLKLGLSTKEIATYTNTSIKSVESRKYRLRKKLHIPSDVAFTTWFFKF